MTAVSAECLGSACRDLLLAGKDLPRAAMAIAEAVLKRTDESGTTAAIKTPQYVFEEAVNEPSLSHNHVSPAKLYRNHLSAHEVTRCFPPKFTELSILLYKKMIISAQKRKVLV